MVETIIEKKINNNNQAPPIQQSSVPVKFFVQLFNLSTYKADKKRLNSIVTNHVQPTNQNAPLSVVTYYKPCKISSHFSTRSRADNVNRVNVVYSFTCNENSCNDSYIGYTSQTLLNRIKQHKRHSSSICKHFMCDHDKVPPQSLDEFSDCFEILFSSENVLTLKIVEAIKIKAENPKINVKFNELYDFLNLF